MPVRRKTHRALTVMLNGRGRGTVARSSPHATGSLAISDDNGLTYTQSLDPFELLPKRLT